MQELIEKCLREATILPARSPFDRSEWYGMLADTGLQPLIVTAQQDEAQAAMALLQEKGPLNTGILTPFRNWYSFTWRPIAPANGTGELLFEEIARQLKSRAARVTLEPVPEEDGMASRLALAFTHAGWRVEVSQCDTNHILNVQGMSFAEYWAQRPGKLRTTLKRKAKKVDVQMLTTFDPKLWAEYEAIYAASWKPEEDHPAMLREFARQEGEAGRLRFAIAFHQGKAVAAQCWSVENGIAYIHKLAYLESARNLSAGTTLSAALMEHVIDKDRVELVDFGTGDQSYKADWMNDTRPRYRIDCINMKSLGGWLNLARLTFARLRERDVPMLAPYPPRG